MNARDWRLGIILTVAAVGQIALAVLFYDPAANAARINVGWGILTVSGICGWLPIFTFRRHGKVKGKGCIQTTQLVDRGVYAVVRHPQYLAGILLGISLPFITWHGAVAGLGLVVAGISYWTTYLEEEVLLVKFGEEYEQYRQRVPRVNIILGVLRLLLRVFPPGDKQDEGD
jgi:protein-S-isoprenylcysteine O-methyltransferase Ste14